MIKFVSKKFLALAVICTATALSAQGQTLVDIWSYSGGGLSPASYSGQYRPPVLNPDAASDAGGSINVSGMTSGGLGSSNFPEGYGGIYTFFSAAPSFTFETTNILSGIQTVSVSFLGSEVYNNASLVLNYNVGNTSLVSGGYSAIDAGTVESPVGPTAMTLYTWTWDVSSLGVSTGFTITGWTAGPHAFFNDISMTQAVPEPSTYALVGLGLGAALVLRKRFRKSSTPSA